MGQAGLPEKYITEALADEEGLTIHFKDDKMFIPTNKIKATIKGVSQETFPDKFNSNGGKPYHLVYFEWKPNTPKQQKLL